MSKICIGLIRNVTKGEIEKIREIIEKIVNKKKYGVFFENISYEPFFEILGDNDMLFSLADNYIFDNCEKLLLRDNNSINDQFDNCTFIEKMKFIQQLIGDIIDMGYQLEMYIGDSGTLTNEYNDILLTKGEFVSFMLLSNEYEDYHFVLS